MALTKEKKQKLIEDLRDKVSRQKSMILIGFSGIKVKELAELRKKLRESEAGLKVVKKNLADIVFKEKKINFKKDNFKEEIAFVFGFGDEVSPAKAVYEFSKDNESLKILGGYMENEEKDKETIMALAQLPSREELYAKLAGSVASPLSGFVNVLQGNIKGLVCALSAIKEAKN